MNDYANRVISHLTHTEVTQHRPLAYFDRNGGDYPWFLREPDGTESSHATLGAAVDEGLQVYQGVDMRTRHQAPQA